MSDLRSPIRLNKTFYRDVLVVWIEHEEAHLRWNTAVFWLDEYSAIVIDVRNAFCFLYSRHVFNVLNVFFYFWTFLIL